MFAEECDETRPEHHAAALIWLMYLVDSEGQVYKGLCAAIPEGTVPGARDPRRRGQGEEVLLLLVTGASGSGKSAALAALAERFPVETVTCAEFDSIGVPAGADNAWRHGAVERWVQHALVEQFQGRHRSRDARG